VSPLDDSLAAAYLERLGVEARRGEVDATTLAALQRAHQAAVPYENLDIVRGSPPAIDAAACARRIVAGRGGYCFHLNGGFAALLEWLGVDVTRHLAGVQGGSAPEPPGSNGNHLGLTVDVDGASWLVDAGLGDGPPEPIPLTAGTYEQDDFAFRLEHSPLAAGGWRLHHDPRGGFVLVDFAAESASTGDFAAMHEKLSTDPESGFVRVATAQRRAGARFEVLRGCVFTEREGAEERQRDVDSADDWWGLVIDWFRLSYGDLTAAECDHLWLKVRATHDAWDAAGRP
jgi:N-hydroxyarylamine O-acetyltransferase